MTDTVLVEDIDRPVLTAEDLVYMEDRVLEWNVLFGNNLDDKSLVPTYRNLCIEEGSEGVTASDQGDMAELLDALIDSVFTGFMLNRLSDGKRYGRWFHAVVRKHHEITDWKVLIAQLSSSKDVHDYYEYTTDLPIVIVQASDKFDILGAFERVCESNFSKAIPIAKVESGEIVIQDCIKEVLDAGRYSDVFSEEANGYIIIKARVDTSEGKAYAGGKIVKGSWYSSVEALGGLEEFIY